MIKILVDFTQQNIETGKYFKFKRGKKYPVYSSNEESVIIDVDSYDEPDWFSISEEDDFEEDEYILEGLVELPMKLEGEMFEFLDDEGY
ncbi:hypothetical protein [Lysinibacillus pakistanensis]|uniref:hypothetical protein n=1 Tax=Lysinibacillus pakistanensis TaxID=759811 RepID=UPI003D289F7B